MTGPKAAPPVFPLPGHRTMAQVVRDERMAEHIAVAFLMEEDLDVCERMHRDDMRRSSNRLLAALRKAA